jgi:hypothetical protein
MTSWKGEKNRQQQRQGKNAKGAKVYAKVAEGTARACPGG